MGTLLPDPFFTGTVAAVPKLPNGKPIPYDGGLPDFLFEPTSIDGDIDNAQSPYTLAGDPKRAGSLDEVTFLLEHCFQNKTWPLRVAAPHAKLPIVPPPPSWAGMTG